MRSYKYSCIDTSPFSHYIMHPFWSFVVEFYPRWLAPNLITFIGFLLTVLYFLILSFYDPDFTKCENVPRVVWLLTSFLVFASHTLDGTDGMQARRTESSSPLGELFDHGCDSWVMLFLPVSMMSFVGKYLSPYLLFVGQWTLIFSFLASHWEKCLTGVLYLPWSFDISQVAVSLSYLVTFIFTPAIWGARIGFINIRVCDVLAVCVLLSFWLLTLPVCFYNIAIACWSGKAPVPTFLQVIRPIFGMVVLMAVSFLWVTYSPSGILSRYPRLFLICFSTVASNVTCQVIVAQLSKTAVPLYNDLNLLHGLLVAGLCFGLPISTAASIEFAALVALTVVVVVCHIHYAVSVVQGMCDLLSINVFSINSQK